MLYFIVVLFFIVLMLLNIVFDYFQIHFYKQSIKASVELTEELRKYGKIRNEH